MWLVHTETNIQQLNGRTSNSDRMIYAATYMKTKWCCWILDIVHNRQRMFDLMWLNLTLLVRWSLKKRLKTMKIHLNSDNSLLDAHIFEWIPWILKSVSWHKQCHHCELAISCSLSWSPQFFVSAFILFLSFFPSSLQDIRKSDNCFPFKSTRIPYTKPFLAISILENSYLNSRTMY